MPQNFTFGEALDLLKNGKFVAREGWHKAGMYLGIQNPDAHSANKQSYIWIMPEQGARVPWVASQPDMLSDDWYEVALGGSTTPTQ